jgi:hypothetical protein
MKNNLNPLLHRILFILLPNSSLFVLCHLFPPLLFVMSDLPVSDFPSCLQVTPNAIKLDGKIHFISLCLDLDSLSPLHSKRLSHHFRTVYFSISPFSVELNVDKYVDIRLQNVTDSSVAFKIKTTARDRYLLRPTQDILKPREEKLCKIVLSAMSTYPDATNPKNVKDKFLIQSLPLDSELIKSDGFDLGKFWKLKESEHNPKENIFAFHEERIKCKLNVPAAKRAEQAASKGAEDEREAVAGENKDKENSKSQENQIPTPVNSNSSNVQSPGAPAVNPLPVSVTQSPGAPIPFTIPSANSTQSVQTPKANSPTAANTQSTASSSSSSFPPSTSSSSTSSDLGSDFERSAADRKRRDYNELMDFLVKLTAQMEREKVESANIADKYQKALQTIAQLQKKNAQLVALQSSTTGNADNGKVVDEDEQKAENPQTREFLKRNQESVAAVREAMQQDKKSAASGFGLTQIVIIGLIAFLLGRMLS